jgi:hypothetical protein
MKTFLGILLFSISALASAQTTVATVASTAGLAFSIQTVLVTVTGAEGTVCSLAKQPGSTIFFVWGCTSADGKASSVGQFKTTSTVLTDWALEAGQGGVGPMCLVSGNPTSTVIINGLASVPPVGIVWNCYGSTTIVSGNVTWP